MRFGTVLVILAVFRCPYKTITRKAVNIFTTHSVCNSALTPLVLLSCLTFSDGARGKGGGVGEEGEGV